MQIKSVIPILFDEQFLKIDTYLRTQYPILIKIVELKLLIQFTIFIFIRTYIVLGFFLRKLKANICLIYYAGSKNQIKEFFSKINFIVT